MRLSCRINGFMRPLNPTRVRMDPARPDETLLTMMLFGLVALNLDCQSQRLRAKQEPPPPGFQSCEPNYLSCGVVACRVQGCGFGSPVRVHRGGTRLQQGTKQRKLRRPRKTRPGRQAPQLSLQHGASNGEPAWRQRNRLRPKPRRISKQQPKRSSHKG